MMARHIAAPFGWVSGCFNFGRLGGFILRSLIGLLRVPCPRYVDDFLGCSRQGLAWHGGRCMDVLVELIGVATDAKKSQDDRSEMMALAHLVIVSPKEGKAETRLDGEKADRWSLDFKEALRSGRCSESLVGKFAGRFSWAVTMQHDKIGRAYIRELYMATNDNLPLGNLTYLHKLSCS